VQPGNWLPAIAGEQDPEALAAQVVECGQHLDPVIVEKLLAGYL